MVSTTSPCTHEVLLRTYCLYSCRNTWIRRCRNYSLGKQVRLRQQPSSSGWKPTCMPPFKVYLHLHRWGVRTPINEPRTQHPPTPFHGILSSDNRRGNGILCTHQHQHTSNTKGKAYRGVIADSNTTTGECLDRGMRSCIPRSTTDTPPRVELRKGRLVLHIDKPTLLTFPSRAVREQR